MSELKTTKNTASVSDYLKQVEPAQRRRDARTLASIMRRVTGKRARMWGSSIVGYDSYHYVYASGREGDWLAVGFSPRKTALTIYIMPGFSDYQHLMDKLGRYRTGKSCLYVKRLEDIDLEVLEELIQVSVRDIKARYPG